MVVISLITAGSMLLIGGLIYVIKSTLDDINFYFDNDDDDIEYFG